MMPLLPRLASAGIATGPWLPLQAQRQDRRTRLILLGTGGGPRPRPGRRPVVLGKHLLEI
jgi:hypothetical protein